MAARTTAKTLLALLVAGALAGGCRHKVGPDDDPAANDDDDTSFAEDASDANAAENDAELVASSLVASSPTGTLALASVDLGGGELQTRTIGDGARRIYRPQTCVNVDPGAAAQTATYKFNRCIGPNGLEQVTGELRAHYIASDDHLHLDLTATNLVVNRAKLDWTATADITSIGASRTMLWKAQLSGTTAGGRDFSRTTEMRVTWTPGEACFEIGGVSEGKIKNRDIKTEIVDFRRCNRGCPDPGGRIVVTNMNNGKRVEVQYDGTNRATFIGPKGGKVTVPLLCRA